MKKITSALLALLVCTPFNCHAIDIVTAAISAGAGLVVGYLTGNHEKEKDPAIRLAKLYEHTRLHYNKVEEISESYRTVLHLLAEHTTLEGRIEKLLFHINTTHTRGYDSFLEHLKDDINFIKTARSEAEKTVATWNINCEDPVVTERAQNTKTALLNTIASCSTTLNQLNPLKEFLHNNKLYVSLQKVFTDVHQKYNQEIFAYGSTLVEKQRLLAMILSNQHDNRPGFLVYYLKNMIQEQERFTPYLTNSMIEAYPQLASNIHKLYAILSEIRIIIGQSPQLESHRFLYEQNVREKELREIEQKKINLKEREVRAQEEQVKLSQLRWDNVIRDLRNKDNEIRRAEDNARAERNRLQKEISDLQRELSIYKNRALEIHATSSQKTIEALNREIAHLQHARISLEERRNACIRALHSVSPESYEYYMYKKEIECTDGNLTYLYNQEQRLYAAIEALRRL